VTVSANPRAANLGRWRPALWTFLGVLLVLPVIAMMFTNAVQWTGTDFLAAAAIFAFVGCAIELIVRFVDQSVIRMALICGILFAALAIWADGAIGIL
jgi:hypothetical protein